MRVIVLVLVLHVVLGLPRFGHADTEIGVVVSGDHAIHGASEAEVRWWLTQRKLSIVDAPLSKDGVLTLSNCLSISDMKCARGVVEARATTSTLVVIIGLASGKGAKREVQLSAYWITKKFDVVSVQRTCTRCTEDILSKTIDAVMVDLTRLAPNMTARVKITSSPSGLLVMIDNSAIGVTPLEHDVTPGSHAIALSRDGRVVGERKVEVPAGTTTQVAVPVRAEAARPIATVAPAERRSRRVPALLIGVGATAMITGGILYATSPVPTGASYTYRDTKPAGIVVGAGGAAVAIIGAILLVRGGSSTPTVAVAPGHASFGWAGRF